MDSFEWNKVIGGVLGAVLLVLVIRVGSEFLFEVEEPAKPGYVVEGVASLTRNQWSSSPECARWNTSPPMMPRPPIGLPR